MVYSDIYETFPLEKNSVLIKPYAGPFARSCSALLDYVILFPIVAFCITLLFKDSMGSIGAVVISGHINMVLIQFLVLYVLFFTFLQSLFIYFGAATPGQRFLKLFIVFEEHQANAFFQIWIRQIGVVVSLVCLGVPLLAILYHARHRAFYDRLSECDVLTRASSRVDLPLREKRFLAAGVSASLCFFVTLFFVSLIQSHLSSVKKMRISQSAQNIEKSCFNIEGESTAESLKTGLALNMLNKVSDECLQSVADQAFYEADVKLDALAYFVKYYIQEKGADKDRYLALACNLNIKSELCARSQRGLASDMDQKKVEADFKIFKKLFQPKVGPK